MEHYLQNYSQRYCELFYERFYMVKVLVPVKNETDVYHDNIFSAPRFALYSIDIKESIDKNASRVYYACEYIIENPKLDSEHHEYAGQRDHGICNAEFCSDAHYNLHYELSKSIDECDYILVNHTCETMMRALKETGINLHKISPFLRKTDIAIKNFILGVSLASTLQHIHIRT
jgi:predicted Fe-Mo cluster-binding NifX family protein